MPPTWLAEAGERPFLRHVLARLPGDGHAVAGDVGDGEVFRLDDRQQLIFHAGLTGEEDGVGAFERKGVALVLLQAGDQVGVAVKFEGLLFAVFVGIGELPAVRCGALLREREQDLAVGAAARGGEARDLCRFRRGDGQGVGARGRELVVVGGGDGEGIGGAFPQTGEGVAVAVERAGIGVAVVVGAGEDEAVCSVRMIIRMRISGLRSCCMGSVSSGGS